MPKKQTTDKMVLRWTEKQVDHLQAMLTLIKQDESYIPGFLAKAGKFCKEYNALKKLLKL
jgi:hypothetical protein